MIAVLITAISAQASIEILNQGPITITTDDLDGFAQKIPDDKRIGFFSSTQRIDETLRTILKMKHVVNYAKSKNLIDEDLVKSNVESMLIEKALYDSENQSAVMVPKDNTLLKQYLTLEESYRIVQKNMRESVKKEDLEELANEQFLINKEKYKNPETRDFYYFNVTYNENNKEDQRIKAEKIQKELEANDLNKDWLKDNYKDSTDVEIVDTLKNYEWDKRYQKFSNLVFKPQSIGMVDEIIDSNSRYTVVVLLNIKKESNKKYAEVKDGILNDLVKEKYKRNFSNLITKITQDKINISNNIFDKLKTRYINKQ